QIGKNFAPEAAASNVTGTDILKEAYKMVLKAKKIINARYVWLECEDNCKILNFYKKFGFYEVDGYISGNGLRVMIMKL
ncbi:GNAT family N-acetyltransferase, partial [Streptococcus danieliae]|nr:GNAT family N-acetyltransferase [Streptococcus danieliae]